MSWRPQTWECNGAGSEDEEEDEGTVEKDKGIVEEDEGTVEEDEGTVEEDEGTIEDNYEAEEERDGEEGRQREAVVQAAYRRTII
jgi:hypothetical protein